VDRTLNHVDALFNPFVRLRGARALAVGVAVVAVLALASFSSGVHLDGALDLHIGRGHAHLSRILLESLVDWLSLAAAFVIIARFLGLRTPPLDALGMTAIARAPFIPIAVLSGKWALGGVLGRVAEAEPDGTIRVHPQAASSPGAILFSLVALVAIIWTIVLLWAAFKEATTAKGGKAAIGVGGSILAAEVLSKLVLAAAG
jgi:hypothetical protein